MSANTLKPTHTASLTALRAHIVSVALTAAFIATIAYGALGG